jgi:excisionase family DNA binding protein
VTTRSGRGRWQRVVDARKQARSALGHDPNQTDLFDAPPPKKARPYVPLAPPVEPRRDESIAVLNLGEAGARLGISRAELEKMIASGKIEALPTGFTRMIPTREVKRLVGRRES